MMWLIKFINRTKYAFRFFIKRFVYGLKLKFPVAIGDKVRIVNKGKIVVGKNTIISRFSDIESYENASLVIGDYVFINKGATIVSRDSINIGNNTILGEYVSIYDHDHKISCSMYDRRYVYDKDKVVIGNNVWIGRGVVITKGVSIGDNSIIAANTVITKDVPKSTLVRTQINYVEKKLEI